MAHERTLALDLARNFGWACLSDNKILSGHQTLPGSTVEAKWFALSQWLDKFATDHFDTFVIETYSFEGDRQRNQRLAHQASGGYRATVTNWCHAHKRNYHFLDQAIVKEITGSRLAGHFLPRGKLPPAKQGAIWWAQYYVPGKKLKSHDEADAIALLVSYLMLEKQYLVTG